MYSTSLRSPDSICENTNICNLITVKICSVYRHEIGVRCKCTSLPSPHSTCGNTQGMMLLLLLYTPIGKILIPNLRA